MILLPYFPWQHIWPLFIQLLAPSTNSWFPVIPAWAFELNTTWSTDQHKTLPYFRFWNILKMPFWRHFEMPIAPMFHTHTTLKIAWLSAFPHFYHSCIHWACHTSSSLTSRPPSEQHIHPPVFLRKFSKMGSSKAIIYPAGYYRFIKCTNTVSNIFKGYQNEDEKRKIKKL